MSKSIQCFNYFSLFILVSSIFVIRTCFSDESSLDGNFKLGDGCKHKEQCQNATSNSTCADGICVCEVGFFHFQRINNSSCESNTVDKTDEEYVGSPEAPKIRHQQVDLNMIIIMVVLAVMFIGICVALHLFSKARFWNRRTIFNSPHPRLMHIKLGKKKGRRRTSHASLEMPGSRQLSICSQLSPLQSRRGSAIASSGLSNQTRKPNGEKKEYTSHAHKQEQAETHKNSETSGHIINGPGSPTVIVASRGGQKCNDSSASEKV